MPVLNDLHEVKELLSVKYLDTEVDVNEQVRLRHLDEEPVKRTRHTCDSDFLEEFHDVEVENLVAVETGLAQKKVKYILLIHIFFSSMNVFINFSQFIEIHGDNRREVTDFEFPLNFPKKKISKPDICSELLIISVDQIGLEPMTSRL